MLSSPVRLLAGQGGIIGALLCTSDFLHHLRPWTPPRITRPLEHAPPNTLSGILCGPINGLLRGNPLGLCYVSRVRCGGECPPDFTVLGEILCGAGVGGTPRGRSSSCEQS